MSTLKTQSRRGYFLSTILLFLGNVFFFLTLWLLKQYDKIFFDQVLYQLKAPTAGVQRALVGNAVLWTAGFGLLATALEVFLWLLLSGRGKKILLKSKGYAAYCSSRVCGFFRKRHRALSAMTLVLCLAFTLGQLDVLLYVKTVCTNSDFIENHYADPRQTALTFPEKKRNLVYIYLESMESSFADPAAGGPIAEDYIPELAALAQENIHFSHKAGLGGAYSCLGTTWTAAAMVSQTGGIPLKVPLAANAYGKQDVYMPGLAALGDILADAGYEQTLLEGSDAEFHGQEAYFVQHGDYNILDIKAFKEMGKLPQDYHEWWGFEDEKLFSFARDELLRLASGDKPFNLTLFTLDTHFPDGYHCRLCENNYESQYANVLACSSKQVYDFVRWIQEQPFYENTTIILSGDHLSMDADFFDDMEEGYVRTIYNCIINAPVVPEGGQTRQFASFDMFPTTLAALGVQIEGDRLGLGTNLFSAKKTLMEQYGLAFLDNELQKNSVFYNKRFLGM